MTLRQNLVSLLLGLVALGGLVAFALLPAAADDDPPTPAEETSASAEADEHACRAVELVLAQAPYEPALEDVAVGLDLEEQGGDGGTGFYDWVDVESLSQTLGELSDGIAAAASTPGLSEDLHDGALAVVEASTTLDQAVTGGIFVTGEVRDAHVELGTSILRLRDLCA